MRFKPTLGITFLVPILSLLASVRAAPSGLQSRGSSPTWPLDIAFSQPTRWQEVKPGSVLTLQFFVTHQELEPDPLPPWTVGFWLVSFYSAIPLKTDNIHPGNYSSYDLTIPGYVSGPGAISCYYNGQWVAQSEPVIIAENFTLG
ncbi:hypothetical protein BC826DRAFT_1001385 [Russula brevipes]|nr:hypothetical protein BC826DRAFT_1001385 [Russula brevipes]